MRNLLNTLALELELLDIFIYQGQSRISWRVGCIIIYVGNDKAVGIRTTKLDQCYLQITSIAQTCVKNILNT